MGEDFARLAAKEEPRHAAPAVRGHHDEVAFALLRGVEDGAPGLAADHRTALGLDELDDALEIDDLGDGHALAAAVALVVAGGGEIVAVEAVEPTRIVR